MNSIGSFITDLIIIVIGGVLLFLSLRIGLDAIKVLYKINDHLDKLNDKDHENSENPKKS